MEHVAVYCRVSTEEQRERQSIETQIEYAKQYCQREGYIIADFYSDNGVSGTIPFDERGAGNKLLLDAKEGKFKSVLVYKIDRIGRDNPVTLEAVFKLNELGVNIKSMTEISDRTNPQGRFLFNLFANLAEWEKEQIRERTIDGKYRKARSGKFPGGIVPYGYVINKEKLLEIDENPIPGYNLSPAYIARQIFNWIGNEGISTIETARKLNDLGVPATKSTGHIASVNGKWRHDRIRKMIISTAYIGSYTYGNRKSRRDNTREKVIIPIPAMIDRELWLKAQETLKRNRKFSDRNSKYEYLLRGLIKCNFCNHGYCGFRKRGGPYYYRCYARLKHYKMIYGECTGRGKAVRGDWIESVVWNEIKNWVLNPVILEEIISAKLKEYEKEKGSAFKTYSRLKGSIEKKQQERTRILELYRKGVITMEDVQTQLEAVESEEKQLIQMAEEHKAKLVENLSHEELIKHFKEEMKVYRDKFESGPTFKDKQRIVQAFIKEVRVNMNGRKAGRLTLAETIPFRNEIEPISLKDVKIVTVYSRSDSRNKEESLSPDTNSNFADVIYRFPFPTKDLGVTVNSILPQNLYPLRL
ncbi:MAG TPA: recombinase family protein [Thermodesulfobacteriota bacterium]|nr:recombinase family protein [Thermodesulfobacteriota bacterium]